MRFFKIWPFVPTVLVFLVIAYLSLAEDPVHAEEMHLFEGADKVVHGCMYLGLVVVGCYDLYRLGFGFTPGRLVAWLLVAIAWGGLMELLQGAMGAVPTGSISWPTVAGRCWGFCWARGVCRGSFVGTGGRAYSMSSMISANSSRMAWSRSTTCWVRATLSRLFLSTCLAPSILSLRSLSR